MPCRSCKTLQVQGCIPYTAGGNKVKESNRSYKRSQNTLRKKPKLQITKLQTINNDKYSVPGRQAGKTQQPLHLLRDSLKTNLKCWFALFFCFVGWCCSFPSYSQEICRALWSKYLVRPLPLSSHSFPMQVLLV